jgi:hypothetical protein
MFEPSALDGGPSGLANWPRPFVFRATRLDGRTLKAGTPFSFDLNLFDMRRPAVAYLVLSFAQMAREGLGPGRGRADLTGVWRLGEQGDPVARVFDGERFVFEESPEPLEIRLAAEEPVARVKVRFLTPTELKSAQEVSSLPEFKILAGRIRDRLSTLRACYDDGPLDLDFRAFGERAARVRMTRCEIDRVEVERRSSRTGQSHSIGGFVGEAEYVGELGEFMPYLKAARWVGVGRQTVWGKGEIAVEPASE